MLKVNIVVSNLLNVIIYRRLTHTAEEILLCSQDLATYMVLFGGGGNMMRGWHQNSGGGGRQRHQQTWEKRKKNETRKRMRRRTRGPRERLSFPETNENSIVFIRKKEKHPKELCGSVGGWGAIVLGLYFHRGWVMTDCCWRPVTGFSGVLWHCHHICSHISVGGVSKGGNLTSLLFCT